MKSSEKNERIPKAGLNAENDGCPGVDGMACDELMPWLKANGQKLIQSLMKGKYRPSPVKRVEIPKDGGGKRQLGIPTAIDRLIQQAISQVLVPVHEEQFSPWSYGFRPNRSCHDAVTQAAEITEVKLLGYAFYFRNGDGTCRLVPHEKSIARLKDNLKELTASGNGWGHGRRKEALRTYIVGWVSYFKLADMAWMVQRIDGWLRRRIRACIWTAWKLCKTRRRNLHVLKVPKRDADRWGNTRKGAWRIAKSWVLTKSLTNALLKRRGWVCLGDYYVHP